MTSCVQKIKYNKRSLTQASEELMMVCVVCVLSSPGGLGRSSGLGDCQNLCLPFEKCLQNQQVF